MLGRNPGTDAHAECLAATLFGPELMGGPWEQQKFTNLHSPGNEKCRSSSLSGASTASGDTATWSPGQSSPFSDVELSPNRGTLMHVEGIGPIDERVVRSMQSLPATSNTFVYVDGIGPVKHHFVCPRLQLLPECNPSKAAASPEVVGSVMSDAGARRSAPEDKAATVMAAAWRFAGEPPQGCSSLLPDHLSLPGAAYSMASVPPGLAVPAGYSALSHCWEPGTEVVIQGLTRSPTFNGLTGVVHAFDEQSGRYDILLVSPDGFAHQWAKIKGENLQLFIPPALPLPPPPPQAAAR